MSTTIKWAIQQKKVSDLREWDKNPRSIPEKKLSDLKSSIEKFGLAEPIVINTDHTIIGGHARVRALKLQAVDVCDCYVCDRLLNEEEIKELNIRLNKNVMDWDFIKLNENFEETELTDWGFLKYELGKIDEIDQCDDWKGMPEFEAGEEPYQTLKIHFDNETDVKKFADLLNQKITGKTKSVWYPAKEKRDMKTKVLKSDAA